MIEAHSLMTFDFVEDEPAELVAKTQNDFIESPGEILSETALCAVWTLQLRKKRINFLSFFWLIA